MAASLNKVCLIGHLGKDPEIKSFNNGGKVANLSVATSESWKDRNTGEWKENTDWHKVAVLNEHLVGQVEKNLRKGSRVYLEGKLKTRKYQDQSGQDRYITEIVVQGYDSKMMLLDARQSRNDNHEYGSSGTGHSSAPRTSVDDDDLPF